MGGRGATPGKRLMGLRVVARDGARLTGGAVIARNAMREIEVFLPLSFLAAQSAEGTADAFLILFALLWSGIFLFFPLFNRDRLRVGDLVAGHVGRPHGAKAQLVDRPRRRARTAPRRTFTARGARALRRLRTADAGGGAPQRRRRRDRHRRARRSAARRGCADDGDDYGFLSDYYAALCASP